MQNLFNRYLGGSTYSELHDILFSIDLIIFLFKVVDDQLFQQSCLFKIFYSKTHYGIYMQCSKLKKFHTQTGKKNLWILLLVLFREKKKKPNTDILKQLLWATVSYRITI